MRKILVAILVILAVLAGIIIGIGLDQKFLNTTEDIKYNKAIIAYLNCQEMVDIKSYTADDTTFTVVLEDGTTVCTAKTNVILIKE